MWSLLLVLSITLGALGEIPPEELAVEAPPVEQKPLGRKGMVLEIMMSKQVYKAMRYLWNDYELQREENGSIKQRRVVYERSDAYMVRYCLRTNKKRCFDTVYLLDTSSIQTYNNFIAGVMIRPLENDEDLRNGIMERADGYEFIFQNKTCLFRSYMPVQDSDEEDVVVNEWKDCQDSWHRYGPYLDYLEEVELMDKFNPNPDGIEAAGGKEALKEYLNLKKDTVKDGVHDVEELEGQLSAVLSNIQGEIKQKPIDVKTIGSK